MQYIFKPKALLILAFSGTVYAQTVNQGLLTVSPTTEIATLESFYNLEDAAVFNDGTTYFYADFNNEGIYSFSQGKKSSYAVFQTDQPSAAIQNLAGNAPSEFYDILFDNAMNQSRFDLKNDISVSGTANFISGVVHVDSLKGAFVFKQGAQGINVSNTSHVDGLVEKQGSGDFTFPIGDQGKYRYAAIAKQPNTSHWYYAEYFLKNSNPTYPHKSKTDAIELINTKEYWKVDKGASGQHDVILTLSWDESTTSKELLANRTKDLRIVRWDHKQKLWVNEGGIVDFNAKTVTTPTQVKDTGIFTLGILNSEVVLDGDLVIYNGVTPNGDGHNDHFIIENIERFPNNKVEVYNRWGVKVYSTTGYNNTDNNFKGYSQGRITMDKGQLLPTGTYYYLVDYEYSDKSGSRMIKRSGYLHLETN